MRNELVHNLLDVGEAHVDDECGVGIDEARPIEIERLIGLAMAGDIAHAAGEAAMRQRNARRRRTALRRRDAGDHLIGNAGGFELGRLLAAAPEDEGIAALEPYHRAPGAAEPDQYVVDLGLRN